MPELCQQVWEHHLEQANSVDELRQALKSLGAQGWELVNVIQDGNLDQAQPIKTRRLRRPSEWYAFLKRPQSA